MQALEALSGTCECRFSHDENCPRAGYVVVSIGAQIGADAVPSRRSRSSLSAYLSDVADTLAESHEGAVVIDKRPALYGNNAVTIAFRSPLLDITRESGIGRVVVPAGMLRPGGLSGAFRTFAQAQQAHTSDEPGPLDQVGILDYVAYWSRHDARIGEVQAGFVVWTDGERETFAAYQERALSEPRV